MIDMILMGYLAKLGVETVVEIIAAWKKSGMPTDEEIRALIIDKTPEEYFTK